MKVLPVGDFLCKVGDNAAENWALLEKANKKHWFFHLTDFSSSYVIFECEKLSNEDKYLCAEICVAMSKQKKVKNTVVDVTPCGNVVKGESVGECEYLKDKKVEEVVVRSVKPGLVEELSKELKKMADSSSKASKPEAAPKEPTRGGSSTVVEGELMSLRKHASLGCAVVSFKKPEERDRLLEKTREIQVADRKVKLQPQTDKATGQEVATDIFASWGRQVERDAPLAEEDLLKALESLCLASLDEEKTEKTETAERANIGGDCGAAGGGADGGADGGVVGVVGGSGGAVAGGGGYGSSSPPKVPLAPMTGSEKS
eukprot:TRINITY_DN2062_c5_g1_i1.p1 TRINITY_DN2062_c5_g1~~TRINITY_DN2062_c5_g1_i1.p1  ORF type:complete len:315 (+),score=98.30 TRINITY_DN2062_c5_g1_i1:123-1067(+)